MANQGKVDNIFDVASVQAEQAKVVALLEEVNGKINKIGRVEIQLKGEKSIKGVRDATAQLTAEEKELLKAQKELNTAIEKRAALENEEVIRLKKITIEENNLRKETEQRLKNEVTLQNAVDNSRKKSEAAIKSLIAQRDKLDLSTKEGRETLKELNAEIDKNTALLKASGDGADQQRRKIGAYNEGVKQVEIVNSGAAKSIEKTNEVLSKTGDELGETKEKGAGAVLGIKDITKELTATEPKADKATKGVSKFFGGLKSIANIIPGLGLSGLLLAGFELISTAASAAGNALGIFSSRGYSAKKATEDINEEFAHTSATVAEVKTRLEVLTARTKQAGLTFQEKQSILKNYNNEFGDTIGQAKSYNDLERILVERASVYIRILTLKAKAQAAANLQQKEFQKQLSGELDNTDIASIILQGNSVKAVTDIVRESTAKVESYAKKQAEFEREADDLKLKYHINTEDDKTAKTVKADKDRTKEILAEARKSTYELQKLKDEAALEDAKKVAENDENNADIRTNSAIFAFEKEKKIATDAKNFEIAENKAALAIELADKQNNASEKKALQEKSNSELLILNEKYQQAILQAGQNFAQQLGQIAKDNPGTAPGLLPLPDAEDEYDAQFKALSKFLKATSDLKDKADKKEEQKRRELTKKLIELGREGAETLIAFVNASFENEKRKIDELIAATELKKEKDLEALESATLSAQDRATRIKQIELKAQLDKEALQRRQRELDIKKAQFDRATAIANIIANTAAAVTKSLPNIALAIISGAIGALQLAKVLATPLPKFAEGTESAPGGLAIVGEKGTEAIVEPSGEVSLTPARATLMHLQKGSKVITADKVDQYLMDSAIKKINIPKAIDEKSYGLEMTKAITSELKALGNIVKEKQEIHWNLRNGEWRKSIQKAKQKTEWIDNYRH